jgi:hypothetical protein
MLLSKRVGGYRRMRQPAGVRRQWWRWQMSNPGSRWRYIYRSGRPWSPVPPVIVTFIISYVIVLVFVVTFLLAPALCIDVETR